jgi:glycosyltransferase involved in cell wall biosynthesis
MMAAAQRLGDVTLIHCGGPLDSETIRKWFDVTLDPQRVRFVTVKTAGDVLGHLQRKPILKYALALRYARKVAAEFDLVVGSYGECPFPAKRGVQYINVPIFSSEPKFLRYLNIAHDSFLQSRLRPYYVSFSRWLCGWNIADVSQKNTIVNSAWTASIVRQLYGISSVIARPGVDVKLTPTSPEWTDWSKRNLGFVMLGRIHPSKRLDLGIEIIRRVRSRGHSVELHIVGRAADGYVRQLERSIRGIEHIHLHLNLARPQLERLVGRQKFGLHACKYEHYGIAAAEMQALGCVVFVPDFAGQREVVTNSAHRYLDLDDAVNKICSTLNRMELCSEISASLVGSIREHTQDFEKTVGLVLDKTLAS